MNVVFIGTGLMGRPMAERLLAAGHHLTVFNRTAAKAEPLVARGARRAAGAAAALVAGEATILMLADGAAIRDLLGGGLPALGGRTVIQMSTIAPRESLALADQVRGAGGEYLEAPVLGSIPQAREGRLLVMVGSTAAQLDRFGPLLACFGPQPRRIGEVGQAAALKLALNQIIAAESAALALAVGMVRRSGLGVEALMEILRPSAIYAPTFDAKLPRLLARDFSDPNFPTRLLLKDLDLISREAAGLGLDTAALDGVRTLARRAVERGLGDDDYSSIYQVIDPPAE